MTKRILPILTAAIFVSVSVQAQTAAPPPGPCPMSCDAESFPYWFCDVSWHRVKKCSTNPQSEPGFYPAMVHMPGCVQVIPIDANLDYQPATKVPDPPSLPDRQWIFDRYVNSGLHLLGGWRVPPYEFDYVDFPNYWADETEYDSTIAQWNLDSSNFLNGFDTAHIDESSLDAVDAAAVNWYFNTDYGWLWQYYDSAYVGYQADSVSTPRGSMFPISRFGTTVRLRRMPRTH